MAFSCAEKSSNTLNDKIFLLNELDQAPQFEGGHEEFSKYITQEIKNAPEGTFNSLEDKVYIDFIVNEKGKVIYTKVRTPIPYAAQKVLESILNRSPTWKAGEINGMEVSSLQTIPIKF